MEVVLAKEKVVARFLGEEDFDLWNQFVSRASGGSIYSTTAYLEALCSAAGGSFRILSVCKGDDILGGVALYVVKTPLGTYVANRLLLYYNGIVLKDLQLKFPSEITSRQVTIMSVLQSRLSDLGFRRLLLHNRSSITDIRPFLDSGWSAWPSYSYIVDVGDLDAAWNRVEQNLRRLIERCRQNDVSFLADDDFESFYRLHYETYRRKGAPLYLPMDAYRRYIETLLKQGLCRLFFARLKHGQPAATQLVLLGDHPATHTVCAAGNIKYMSLGTTPFLRWKAFEEINRLGYRANDLTDAALNPVTKFKSQLGGELVVNFVLKRPDALAFRWGERLAFLAKTCLRPACRQYRRMRSHAE